MRNADHVVPYVTQATFTYTLHLFIYLLTYLLTYLLREVV